MVILSVTAGSVVVELGFLRVNGTPANPADNSEIVLRLKSAAVAGELDKFGVTSINVGSDNVFNNQPPRKIVSASVGMFTNNAQVYYKPHTVSSGGGTVRNHRSVSRRT